jgi:hypothetical protein
LALAMALLVACSSRCRAFAARASSANVFILSRSSSRCPPP